MVFYFSATGNSKYVATKIGEEFNCELIDIVAAIKGNKFEYKVKDEEKVFFVFPVYFLGMPNIVAEFIDKIKFSGGIPQICGIVTCGGMPGGIDRIFRKAFKEKELEVNGFYQVKMVDNFVLMFKIPLLEEQIMILRRSEDEIKNIIDSIHFNYRVSYKSGIAVAALGKLAYVGYKPNTKKFRVKENCTGCELCETICSVGAIKLKDGKPQWVKDKCAHCLACINRCPVSAIEYGMGTLKRGRYVNPNIQL